MWGPKNRLQHKIHRDLKCNNMVPSKSRFLGIGFSRHLVGVIFLLQYKIFIRIWLFNNNKQSGSLMKH